MGCRSDVISRAIAGTNRIIQVLAWITTLVCVVNCVVRVDVATRFDETSIIGTKLDRKNLASSLGLEQDLHLKLFSTTVSSPNRLVLRFQEKYLNFSIIGEGVIVKIDLNDIITKARGSLVDKVAVDLDEELRKLTATGGLDDLKVKVVGQRARFVYVLRETEVDNSEALYSIIDAVTRENISSHIPRRQLTKINELEYFKGEGGNLATGRRSYDGQKFNIFMKITDHKYCVLENDFIRAVHTGIESTTLEAYKYECEKGTNDEVNGGYSPLSDSFYSASIVYSMYSEWYGINPFARNVRPTDNYSIPPLIDIWVHYGQQQEQARWNEEKMAMIVGDGKDTTYPLSFPDVIAHEIGHHITMSTSGLHHTEQSGAIDEAFCDMSVAASKSFLGQSQDWRIGTSLFKENGTFLRYLDNPQMDNYSISNAQDYCPGLDGHLGAGVFNKAFYILSNKWNVRKAFEVFLMANIKYWTNFTNFNDGACDVIKVANDLNYSTDEVKEAFLQVGVKPCEPMANFVKNIVKLHKDEERTVSYDFSNSMTVIFCNLDEQATLTIKQGSEELPESQNVNSGFCMKKVIIGHPGITDITIKAIDDITNRLLYVYSNDDVITVAEGAKAVEGQATIDVSFNVDFSSLDDIKKYSLVVLVSFTGQVSDIRLTPRRPYKSEVLDIYFAQGYPAGDTEGVFYACLIKPGMHYLSVVFGDNSSENTVSKVSYVFIKLYPNSQ